ncbi:MAG: hypothetical protein LUE17_06015 [Planctomycetaceae bacterium]|nr:hypothetical protein [Planctomycetaceae bacterium]
MSGPSAILLLSDIRDALRDAFADFSFREPVMDGNPVDADGAEHYCTPHFHLGHLPPKRSDEEQGEDVPYILVKSSGGQWNGEAQPRYLRDVDIVFAVYVPGEDPEAGLHDLENMAERIVGVLTSRLYWQDDYFELASPVTYSQGVGKTDTPYTSGLQAHGNYYQGAISVQFRAMALPKVMHDGIIDAKR